MPWGFEFRVEGSGLEFRVRRVRFEVRGMGFRFMLQVEDSRERGWVLGSSD